MSLEQIFQTICLNLSKLYPKYCWSLFSRHGVYSGEYLNHLSRLLILLSVQCYASTEYNFTCVCVCVCLCVRHTFCQLAYRSDPSTNFLQLIA